MSATAAQPPAAPPPPPPPQPPAPADGNGGHWQLWHTLVSLAIVAAIIALAIWAATSKTLLKDVNGQLPVWTYLALIALFLGFAVLVGWGTTGHVGGLLMDGWKLRITAMSLVTFLTITTIFLLGTFREDS